MTMRVLSNISKQTVPCYPIHWTLSPSWLTLMLYLLASVLTSVYSTTTSNEVPQASSFAQQQYFNIYECPDDQNKEEFENFLTELNNKLDLETNDGTKKRITWEQTMNATLEFYERMSKVNDSNEDEEPLGEPMDLSADNVQVTNLTSASLPLSRDWEPEKKLFWKSDQTSKITFRMESKSFSCLRGIINEFHWHPSWDKLKFENHTFKFSNMSMTQDGNLIWSKGENERHVYKKDDYCISWRKEDFVSFKVCMPNCSDSSPCIRKCCPPSEVIDEETKGCRLANPRWKPIFYRSAGENPDQVAHNPSITFGFPNCQTKYVINADPKNNFKLLLNGTLLQIDDAKRTYINPGEFCIDGIHYINNEEARHGVLEGILNGRSEWDQVVIACRPTKYRWEIDNWRMPLFATLNHISALFLLITDVVYILLWRHKNNIHWWLQFSYATSLFFTFNCFVVVQRWSDQLMSISQSLCKIMGWITHLTYLSAFFWLTSMNFDLWWRFSRPLRSTHMIPHEKNWKRFLGFAGFSIGVPLLISGIGITLDYVYEGMLLEPPFTVPGFGKERCYFENKRSQVPYLYGPAGILLLIDLIFFTSTVLHLRKIHAHTELARTQSTMEDKKGVRVIAKLFIVMGVLWIFELVSWIAYVIFPDKEIMLIWIFIPIDILNSLQGVAIFFIFVCKPNVGSQLLALFRKDDAGKTWNKQTPLPSVTIQQPSKPNDYGEIK